MGIIIICKNPRLFFYHLISRGTVNVHTWCCASSPRRCISYQIFLSNTFETVPWNLTDNKCLEETPDNRWSQQPPSGGNCNCLPPNPRLFCDQNGQATGWHIPGANPATMANKKLGFSPPASALCVALPFVSGGKRWVIIPGDGLAASLPPVCHYGSPSTPAGTVNTSASGVKFITRTRGSDHRAGFHRGTKLAAASVMRTGWRREGGGSRAC